MTTLEPPIPLGEQARIYFNTIVVSRETDTWLPHDLLVASNLAKLYEAIDEQWWALEATGWRMESSKGTPVPNPAASQLMQLTAAARTLSTTLGLSAPQRGVSGKQQGGRNVAEHAARKAIKNAADQGDDLI